MEHREPARNPGIPAPDFATAPNSDVRVRPRKPQASACARSLHPGYDVGDENGRRVPRRPWLFQITNSGPLSRTSKPPFGVACTPAIRTRTKRPKLAVRTAQRLARFSASVSARWVLAHIVRWIFWIVLMAFCEASIFSARPATCACRPETPLVSDSIVSIIDFKIPGAWVMSGKVTSRNDCWTLLAQPERASYSAFRAL